MVTPLNTSDILENSEKISLGILVYIILMSIADVFAVLSNFLAIYCIVRFKKLRTATNVFICNLAVSDILLAGFVMPQKIHDITHDGEDFYEGVVLCKIVNFCPILVITSSIYTLVGISFERHQVVISENREKKFTFRKLAIQIIFIWGFAVGVSIPTLLEYTVREVPITVGNQTIPTLSCGSQTTRVLALTNAVFVLIVSYIIPVILMTRNYIEVAIFVYRKGKKMRENMEPSGINISCIRLLKHRTKVVKLLVTVAAIFAVSWLPFFIILIYAKATGNDASVHSAGFVNLLLLALATFSTAYNVVLYVLFNPSFKRAILGVLRCKSTSEIQDDHVRHTQSQHTPDSPQDGDTLVGTTATSSGSLATITTKAQFTSLDNLETQTSPNKINVKTKQHST